MKSAHCVLEDGTKIRGLEMLRSNATRSASLIQHVIDLGNDTITSEYSEVLFFFTPNWPSLYHLALVRTFPVLSEL